MTSKAKGKHGGARRGSGRPSAFVKPARVTMWMESAHRDALDKVAKEMGTNRSAAFRTIMEAWCGPIDPSIIVKRETECSQSE